MAVSRAAKRKPNGGGGNNVGMVECRPVTLWTCDGLRLAADHWDHGTRDLAAVVAHGFTGWSRNPHVRRICHGLAGHGIGLLAVDFRGHGRSAGQSTAGGDEIRDVAAAVAWLRENGYRSVVTLAGRWVARPSYGTPVSAATPTRWSV